MPTYDYVCKLCQHAFEHFQGIHEPLLRKCPSCGRRSLQRLIGAGAGIVFKGSGFYETDYKRSGATGTPARPTDAKSGATDTGPSSGPQSPPAKDGPSAD
jgi:putative FmdB family regulatory protein